MLLGGL